MVRGRAALMTPSTSKAVSIDGKVSCTSASRIRTVSRTPPTYPASRPKAMPITIANRTDRMPTSKLMRRPNMMADKTSRPWLSVPSGLDQSASLKPIGGLKLSSSDNDATSIGSCGAIHGAKAAAATKIRAITADATAVGDRRKLYKKSLFQACASLNVEASGEDRPRNTLDRQPGLSARRPGRSAED